MTGLAYEANDPAMLLWIHVALVDSRVAARNLFGIGLPAADGDRYVAEMVTAAELAGVPRRVVPASLESVAEYISSVRPQLRCTPAAAESMAYVLEPPGLDEAVAQIWQDLRDGAVASLPSWARDMYGYTAPDLTPARRAEIRQALGLLDVVLLGEPGVLEARQRIALRMRAAQPT